MAVNLSIHVDQYNLNPKTIVVKDASLYEDSGDIDNLILEIKPPGRDEYSFLLVTPEFYEIINCSYLDLCCNGKFSELSDGVYKMKLSYNPNDKTVEEFYHLRVISLKSKYVSAICDLKKNKCNLTRREFTQQEGNLYKIRNQIEAAVWMVEECLDIEKGMELYNNASNALEKYDNCECN